VDDVVGEVVLAAGDEDLGAADLVGTVRLRLGLGAESPTAHREAETAKAHRG